MSETQQTASFELRQFGRFNWIGLYTFVRKEVARFLAVYMQTLVAPVITMALYYVVFALALGGQGREVLGLNFMNFLAPGLIIMTMSQNAFANTSSSIVIAKVQGNIVDILMPPLSALEIYLGYILGSVIRALMIGFLSYAVLWTFTDEGLYNALYLVLFGILGAMMLGTLGLIGGIWSDKFDHIAAVTNFVITPLAFLSGTFYSLEALPSFWKLLANLNPFFHMINGFRYGATGVTEAIIPVSILFLVIVNAALSWVAWKMLVTGYKLKS
ncbi:MAG: ABC transporter permease [Pseudobdellovibrionaceae bacterium]